MHATTALRMVVLAALCLSGCAASHKEVQEPEEAAEEAAEPAPSDEAPDPDALEELGHLFEGKRPIVSRCYGDAVAKGTLDKKAKGKLSLGVTLAADGTVTEVEALEDTLRSPEVKACVLDLVRSWPMPKPGVTTKYTFTYGFEAE